MKPTSVDKEAKLDAFRKKLEHAREHGADVVVDHKDGHDEKYHVRRLPDGSVEWTDEAGNVVPNPGDAA